MLFKSNFVLPIAVVNYSNVNFNGCLGWGRESLFFLLSICLEASVVKWSSYSPCKSEVVGSIPGFSSLSDETLNRGLVSV